MLDTQVKPNEIGEGTQVRQRVLPSGYLDILKSVDTATAKTAGEDGATIDRVKRDLDQRTKGGAKEGAKEGAKPEPGKTGAERGGEKKPGPERREEGKLGDEKKGEQGKPEVDPNVARLQSEGDREREKRLGKVLSIEEMAEILRHGKTLATLSGEDKRRVDELIRLGEASVKAGDYFAAERRFSQAQDYRTGNPLIEVGMAHAQLGGGMYLSSALTLRNLFRTHPELIDTKYDRALLPSGDRLDRTLKLVRDRIVQGEDRVNYGFLLAYMGHQLGDRAMVEEGLAHVKGGEALDTYGALLRGVWLGSK
jgi:hypothetical protein